MKRLSVIVLMIALLGLHGADAHADVVIGGKGGVGILTQNLSPDVQALGVNVDTPPSPTISGFLGYAIGDLVVLGLSLELQFVSVDVAGIDVADAMSLSVMPFVEWHFMGNQGGISPYLFIALGMNFNSFDPSDEVKEMASALFSDKTYSAVAGDTFAFKGGLGADFFVTEGLAINFEAGWRYNSGTLKEYLNQEKFLESDFNASSAIMTVGLKYYF